MKIYPQPERQLLRAQISNFSRQYFENVLDLGGGDGRRYKEFFKFDNYLSLDIDVETKPDIVGDASSTSFLDKTFDLVICSQVLEHVEDHTKVLSEISRVLKDDGVTIITVPFLNEQHSEPLDFFRFTEFGFRKLMNESGFIIIEMARRGNLITVICQFIVRYLIERLNKDLSEFPNRTHKNYVKENFVFFTALILTKIGTSQRVLQPNNSSGILNKWSLGWSVLAKKKS